MILPLVIYSEKESYLHFIPFCCGTTSTQSTVKSSDAINDCLDFAFVRDCGGCLCVKCLSVCVESFYVKFILSREHVHILEVRKIDHQTLNSLSCLICQLPKCHVRTDFIYIPDSNKMNQNFN